jgi:hypothetical protein
MFKNYFLKLNLTVDLATLWNYYNIVDQDYQDLRWSVDKNIHDVEEIWQERMTQELANQLQTGWAIQSNLVDLTIPCPPYDISTLPTTNYRNTKLVFGIIEKLQTLMPWAYRWSLIIQPPGGKVSKHTDQDNEYTAHIPIQWDNDAVFICGEDQDTTITFPATGEIYVLDTTILHSTENRGSLPRIGLIFRFNQTDLPKFLELTGHVE